MRGYTEAHKTIPFRARPNRTGGWSIAILPFMEQKALEDELKDRPLRPPENLAPYGLQRPQVMTCPSSDDVESSLPPIPRSHFFVVGFSSRDGWYVADVPRGSRVPWLVGPEMDWDALKSKGPHSGGFNVAETDGSVHLRMP